MCSRSVNRRVKQSRRSEPAELVPSYVLVPRPMPVSGKLAPPILRLVTMNPMPPLMSGPGRLAPPIRFPLKPQVPPPFLQHRVQPSLTPDRLVVMNMLFIHIPVSLAMTPSLHSIRNEHGPRSVPRVPNA